MVEIPSKVYLVTGAAGFIGARFVESCRSQGITPISVDRWDYFTSRAENREIPFGEVVDLDYLFEWLKNPHPRIDAIIHLGAITDTRETDLEILQRLNLDYSKALWNYSKQENIPFIYASSAATYGDGALGYDDDEALIPKLQPLNAYGNSKQLFDLWALEQDQKGSKPPSWCGFKFFNVYGFGERHKDFMSSVVLHAYDQIRNFSQVTLFKSHRPDIADGHQQRDFIYIDDVIKALHFAAQKPIQRGIFNLGTGTARTFLDLAKAVFVAMDKPEYIHYIDTPASIRDKYQYFTEAKMERLRSQGFPDPFVSLEEGARRYVERLNQWSSGRST